MYLASFRQSFEQTIDTSFHVFVVQANSKTISGITAAAPSAAAAYDNDGTFDNATDNCNGYTPLSLLSFIQSAVTTLDKSLADFMLLDDQPQVISTPICLTNNIFTDESIIGWF